MKDSKSSDGATHHLPFAKGYITKWTGTVPLTYTLSDLMDESIKGKFYEPSPESDTAQRFEILKTCRGANGKIACYPRKSNSWNDEIDIVD